MQRLELKLRKREGQGASPASGAVMQQRSAAQMATLLPSLRFQSAFFLSCSVAFGLRSFAGWCLIALGLCPALGCSVVGAFSRRNGSLRG